MPNESVETSSTVIDGSKLATSVSEKATPATTPVASDKPAEYTPEADSKFSSDDILKIIEKGKTEQPKVEDVNNGEVKIETVGEVKTAEVTPPPVAEVKAAETPKFEATPETIQKLVAEQVEALVSKQPKDEQIKVANDGENFFGYKTQEELDTAYQSDPAATTRKVIESTVKGMVEKQVQDAVKSVVEPLRAQIQPVISELGDRQIKTHFEEAVNQFAELKDQNSPLFKETAKILQDTDLVNKWIKEKKNPIIEATKEFRKNHFDEYLTLAKQQGIKEGEERSAKAARATVEGGGKIVTESAMTPEQFEKLPSNEQLKYLASHGGVRQ